MSFADQLRQVKPYPKPSSSEAYSHLPLEVKIAVEQNLHILKKICEIAARSGEHQVSFYEVTNGYSDVEWTDELSLYEGTAAQRAQARNKLEQYGLGFSPRIFLDRGKADLAAQIILDEMNNMGFTKCEVEVKQFHMLEKKEKYAWKRIVVTYQESSKLFYCLKISASW